MLTTHFKQAWQLIRQNRLFSCIYIAGTALAIASTTIFAIIYYVKLAPVYPEYNREKIVTVSALEYDNPNGYRFATPSFSYGFLNDFLYKLENAQAVSGYRREPDLKPLKRKHDKDHLDVVMHMCDPAFFKILNFEFIAGTPFSQSDFDGGVYKIAISDIVATKLFGNPDAAIGKTVSLDFNDYEICGVFREGSAINSLSYTQALVPYTIIPNYNISFIDDPMNGFYNAMILTDDKQALNAEFDEYCRKYKAVNDGRKIYFNNQPMTAMMRALNPSNNNKFDIMAIIRFNLLILLMLLIVPALNLSGMIAGRMDTRRAELGIRKSFGATGNNILSQILTENLVLTLIGGIIGLALTWIVLSSDATLIFSAIGSSYGRPIDRALTVRLTPDMMFAPAIFAFSFLTCIVLNIMSALIPAWNALRRPIVKSLK